MHVSTRCPQCQKKITAPERWTGREAKCPQCGQAVRFPGPQGRSGILAAKPFAPPPAVVPSPSAITRVAQFDFNAPDPTGSPGLVRPTRRRRESSHALLVAAGVLVALFLAACGLPCHRSSGFADFTLGVGVAVAIALGLMGALAVPRGAPLVLVIAAALGTLLFLGTVRMVSRLPSGASASLTGDPHAFVTPPTLSKDVVVVLESSARMQPYFEGVKQGLHQYGVKLLTADPQARLSLILFQTRQEKKLRPRDAEEEDGNSTFTRDAEAFSREVGKLVAEGGGDEPESTLDALVLGSRQPFREKAEKVLVLVTDASAKVPDKETKSVSEAISRLKDNKINQVHLVINPKDRNQFRPFEKAFNGQYFPLTRTGNQTAFAKLLPEVSKSIAEISMQTRGLRPGLKAVPVDVLFLLDITGSMGSEIRAAKLGISSFARDLLARKIDARIGLIGFRDQFFDKKVFEILSFESSKRPEQFDTVWTSTVQATQPGGGFFTRQLIQFNQAVDQSQDQLSGADAQSSFDALAKAARQPFRTDASKTILLITASAPRVPDQEMLTALDVAELMAEKHVHFLHVMVPQELHKNYRALRVGAPGHSVNLKDAGAWEQLAQKAPPASAPVPPAEPSRPVEDPPSPVHIGLGAWLGFGIAACLLVVLLFLAWRRPFNLFLDEESENAPTFWTQRATLVMGQGAALAIGLVWLIV